MIEKWTAKYDPDTKRFNTQEVVWEPISLFEYLAEVALLNRDYDAGRLEALEEEVRLLRVAVARLMSGLMSESQILEVFPTKRGYRVAPEKGDALPVPVEGNGE